MSVTFFFLFFPLLFSFFIPTTYFRPQTLPSIHLILLFIFFFPSLFFYFSIIFFPFHLSDQVCIKETNTSTYQLPPSPPLSSSLPFSSFSLSFPLFHSLLEGIVHPYAISTNPTRPFGGRSGYRRLHGSRQGRVSLE